MITDINATIRKLSRMRSNAFHLGGHPPTDAEYEAQVAKLEREIVDEIRALAASAGDAALGVPAERELLMDLVEGVRQFRNEPSLERLGQLRGTPGFCAMVGAWDDARDFLEEDAPAATAQQSLQVAPSAPAAPQVDAEIPCTVDELAECIRRVDGNHTLGAGALAEEIVCWMVERAAASPDAAPQVAAAPEVATLAGSQVVIDEHGPLELRATVTVPKPFEHSVIVNREDESDNWYLLVMGEDGMRSCDGYWQDSAHRSCSDALREAIRGADLGPDADRAAQAACTGGAS